jgi:succinate-semialdehyde dehydrogenase / glutarate-semialdehyde dehydrogenase
MKREVLLYIDGLWRPGAESQTLAVFNPATEVQIGTVAKASRVDLDQALGSAAEGFAT